MATSDERERLVGVGTTEEELAAVQERIACTDRLIDLIVYRLYGLTTGEVKVVEAWKFAPIQW